MSLRRAAEAITINIFASGQRKKTFCFFRKSGYSIAGEYKEVKEEKKLILYSVKLIFNIILYFIRDEDVIMSPFAIVCRHTNLSGNVICFLSF